MPKIIEGENLKVQIKKDIIPFEGVQTIALGHDGKLKFNHEDLKSSGGRLKNNVIHFWFYTPDTVTQNNDGGTKNYQIIGNVEDGNVYNLYRHCFSLGIARHSNKSRKLILYLTGNTAGVEEHEIATLSEYRNKWNMITIIFNESGNNRNIKLYWNKDKKVDSTHEVNSSEDFGVAFDETELINESRDITESTDLNEDTNSISDFISFLFGNTKIEDDQGIVTDDLYFHNQYKTNTHIASFFTGKYKKDKVIWDDKYIEYIFEARKTYNSSR